MPSRSGRSRVNSPCRRRAHSGRSGPLPGPPGRRAAAVVGGARVAEQRHRRLLRRGAARDARRLGARTGVAALVRDGRPRPVLRDTRALEHLVDTRAYRSPRPRPPAPRAVRDTVVYPALPRRVARRQSTGRSFSSRAPLRGMETTAVAANLGRALSTTDARVLVVSADLGSPRLHEWLGAPRAPGLADVLDALSLPAEQTRRGIESVPRGRIPRRDPPLKLGHVPNARRDADREGRRRSQGA